MATAKKSTKSSARKSTTKKSVSRTAPARKKASGASKTRSQAVQSFRISKPTRPFMSFGFSRESSYWLVLGVVVIAFGWWIMKLQSDIQAIYDSIDANSNSVITQPVKKPSTKN